MPLVAKGAIDQLISHNNLTDSIDYAMPTLLRQDRNGRNIMVDTALEDLAFQQQFEQAQAAAVQASITEPRAIAAYYDVSAALVVVRLRSGASFSFPPSIAQGLSGAAPDDLVQLEITPMGDGVE
jgi:hypothetical protein